MHSTSPTVDLTHSPHARLKPVPLDAVQLADHFWQPRREVNRSRTLKSQHAHMEATGRLANFRRAAGLEAGEFEGIYFNDSDVYKWLEAAASSLADGADEELRGMINEVASIIAAAQREDGYLHTFYTLHPEKPRWENLRDMHQLYCMGHFIQAAVAHLGASGETSLLEVATRLADCIDHDFGWGKIEQTDGHEEIELALVSLYRATQEPRYLKLAQFFVDVRGRGTIGGSDYHQDHVPARELKRVTGHAVRALYYGCGLTDLFLETGETALLEAIEAQWANYTAKQMYVSGGAGSRWEGEAFGFDFELPNQRAYTETCAAIAAVMWGWRLGQHKGEARFFDILERVLYNAVMSGLSLGGDEYFYQNPLANDGTHRRQQWFGCACCPPNVARLLAQLPSYFYSVSGLEIWAHLFAAGRATFELANGEQVVLSQQTNFPWDGEVTFTVESTPQSEWSLCVRIPNWAKGATLEISGESQQVTVGEYARINRVWKDADTLTLRLPMEVRLVRSHPHAIENTGRVAVMRGPLLYCAEAVDHRGVDLRDLQVSGDLEARFEDELLGGVVTLQGEGRVVALDESWQTQLYDSAEQGAESSEPIQLKLVPYYAWANREAGAMQVWLLDK